jgi:hypothetical protein
MVNITVWVVYAGSYRNVRFGYWAKYVGHCADGFEVFVYGLVADVWYVVGFENHVAVRTDVDYTADSLQAGAIPSPR